MSEPRNVFLWRKITTPDWIESHREEVEAISPERLAIIERPGFKRILIEVNCRSRAEAHRLRTRHGGEIEQLQRNWLTTFNRAQKRKPLRVGRRLVVFDDQESWARENNAGPSLTIPSGVAFGTGDHPTTAMTLRLLEETTRELKTGWSMADLGTGSGILSLAAHRLGASAVEAIDFDPTAIATAKANARLNRIRGIKFSVADVLRWRCRAALDVITANLFSELLIGALPEIRRSLKTNGRFILSGVLRSEEAAVAKAIGERGLRLDTVRRRGKWIALAGRRTARQPGAA